jgi:myo-inositol-1(or 4)-monophosphatase
MDQLLRSEVRSEKAGAAAGRGAVDETLSEYAELRRQASGWIVAAGEIALDRFGKAVAQRKADRSLVTDADHAVQQFLLDAIARCCPDDCVITEETQAAPERHAEVGAAHRCWVIDPIDGTRSYARSFPGFCVSMALMEGGRPVVGLVYNPLTRQLYHAIVGGGAWLDERRLGVTDEPLGCDTLLAIPSSRRGPMPRPVHDWIDRFVVRNLGSTALHLALLAAGAVDAVFADECRLWDIAAGELLVREAGGQLISFSGQPYFPMDLALYGREETPFMAAGPSMLPALFDEFVRPEA